MSGERVEGWGFDIIFNSTFAHIHIYTYHSFSTSGSLDQDDFVEALSGLGQSMSLWIGAFGACMQTNVDMVYI